MGLKDEKNYNPSFDGIKKMDKNPIIRIRFSKWKWFFGINFLDILYIFQKYFVSMLLENNKRLTGFSLYFIEKQSHILCSSFSITYKEKPIHLLFFSKNMDKNISEIQLTNDNCRWVSETQLANDNCRWLLHFIPYRYWM